MDIDAQLDTYPSLNFIMLTEVIYLLLYNNYYIANW